MNDESIKLLAAVIKERLATVERYDLELVGRGYMYSNDLVDRPDGDWVKFEDICKALGIHEV